MKTKNWCTVFAFFFLVYSILTAISILFLIEDCSKYYIALLCLITSVFYYNIIKNERKYDNM